MQHDNGQLPVCPITCEPFVNPVVAADGHTYERHAITKWLSQNDRSPITNIPLPNKTLVPNFTLRKILTEHKVQQSPGTAGMIASLSTSMSNLSMNQFKHTNKETIQFEGNLCFPQVYQVVKPFGTTWKNGIRLMFQPGTLLSAINLISTPRAVYLVTIGKQFSSSSSSTTPTAKNQTKMYERVVKLEHFGMAPLDCLVPLQIVKTQRVYSVQTTFQELRLTPNQVLLWNGSNKILKQGDFCYSNCSVWDPTTGITFLHVIIDGKWYWLPDSLRICTGDLLTLQRHQVESFCQVFNKKKAQQQRIVYEVVETPGIFLSHAPDHAVKFYIKTKSTNTTTTSTTSTTVSQQETFVLLPTGTLCLPILKTCGKEGDVFFRLCLDNGLYGWIPLSHRGKKKLKKWSKKPQLLCNKKTIGSQIQLFLGSKQNQWFVNFKNNLTKNKNYYFGDEIDLNFKNDFLFYQNKSKIEFFSISKDFSTWFLKLNDGLDGLDSAIDQVCHLDDVDNKKIVIHGSNQMTSMVKHYEKIDKIFFGATESTFVMVLPNEEIKFSMDLSRLNSFFQNKPLVQVSFFGQKSFFLQYQQDDDDEEQQPQDRESNFWWHIAEEDQDETQSLKKAIKKCLMEQKENPIVSIHQYSDCMEWIILREQDFITSDSFPSELLDILSLLYQEILEECEAREKLIEAYERLLH